MRVFPAYFEKSTMTSARSAGARSRACRSTLPKSNRVGSVIQVMGWLGITAGAGRKPPSLPIWIQLGPAGLSAVSGVGYTVGSSCAAATSAALSATSVPVASATYHCRFQNRSLAALRIRSRYGRGCRVTVG